MQRLINFLSLAIFATALSVGQVMFKRVGLTIRGRTLLDSVLYILGSNTFYVVLFIYALFIAGLSLSGDRHSDRPFIGMVRFRRARRTAVLAWHLADYGRNNRNTVRFKIGLIVYGVSTVGRDRARPRGAAWRQDPKS